jgi:hypothetical protein
MVHVSVDFSPFNEMMISLHVIQNPSHHPYRKLLMVHSAKEAHRTPRGKGAPGTEINYFQKQQCLRKQSKIKTALLFGRTVFISYLHRGILLHRRSTMLRPS